MAAFAIGVSFGLVQLDTWLGVEVVRDLGWLYTFGPEGARAILSAIASSMITVAGLTFSITMLTLQLASSQFGPRLLRNFMRDRGNQIVLGTFIATFVYCLLVLRTVRGIEGSSFVPHISVAFGVLLAIASLAVLIYFIHHVANSIRIETLLASLAAETRDTIDRLYPEEIGRDPPVDTEGRAELPGDFDRSSRPVRVQTSGYIQRIDDKALMRAACEHDLIVRVDARPGRFVTEHDSILSAYPNDRTSDDAADRLRSTVIVGSERTPREDLEFSIRRIVEIAERALSPGINDPTTALYCLDRLGEVFCRLAERPLPSPMRFDENRRLRVLTEVSTLEDLACRAFAAVARYGMKDADVIRHLLEVMDALSRKANPSARKAIADLASAIRCEGVEQLYLSVDKKTVRVTASEQGLRR